MPRSKRSGTPTTRDQRIDWERRQLAKGLCVSCILPAVNRRHCARHRTEAYRKTQKLKDLRKSLGLCTDCGRSLGLHSTRLCDPHFEKQQAYHAKYVRPER